MSKKPDVNLAKRTEGENSRNERNWRTIRVPKTVHEKLKALTDKLGINLGTAVEQACNDLISRSVVRLEADGKQQRLKNMGSW
jgi:hypothetical protein